VREGSAVARALQGFKLLLVATLNEIIRTGRHFNPDVLQRAFQMYDNYFADIYTDPPALLFWQQVVGYIQRFLPANYMQAFCDEGLSITEEKLRKGEPQGRSLRIDVWDSHRNNWSTVNIYPLSSSSLGSDFAIYGRSQHCAGVHLTSAALWPVAVFSKLISIKNSVCGRTNTSAETSETTRRGLIAR
jgi:hypothetical protein